VSGLFGYLGDLLSGDGVLLTASHTFDWMNHLTGGSMTRAGIQQNRTFTFNTAGELVSAYNPENGTVNYSYNSDMTLQSKVDAKGQVTVYSYDAAKRITEVQIYPNGLSGWSGYYNGVNWSEDICQRVTYGYDAGTYGLGRLTSINYGASPALEAMYLANGWGITPVRATVAAMLIRRLMPIIRRGL
jgi:YD repeat-containing protein